MPLSERQTRILSELKNRPGITVKELAPLLFVSEPTVRRDLTELENRGFLTKKYGGAVLRFGAADREIPFYIRENENVSLKSAMAARAAELVPDGATVMLDGSTSAYYLAEHLAAKKDIIVITSGAKTAVALADADVRVFCTGGQMLIHSFSYVGAQAESFVSTMNADILFFSCHGLSSDGTLTDPSVEEANLRRVMFKSAKKKYLLCDKSKFDRTFLYNFGSVSELDGIISDGAVPEHIRKMLKGEAL